MDDATLIGAVASILAGDALTWYTATFPVGTLNPALRSWSAFRDLFLAEHMDPDQSSKSIDNLLGDRRFIQMNPGRHSLNEYVRSFQQEMSLLSTSASIGQPNAPGPPTDAWKKEFFWAGLHPVIRGTLAPERHTLKTVDALKRRALQVAGTYDDPPEEHAGSWTVVSQGMQAPGRMPLPSPSNGSHRTSPCTHPAHTRGSVNHSWDQCSLNPASPNFQNAKFARRQDAHGQRSPGMSGTMNHVRGLLGDTPSLRASVPLFTESPSGEPVVSTTGGTGAAATSQGFVLGNIYEVLPEEY